MTKAILNEYAGKEVEVILKDGRKLRGVLGTFTELGKKQPCMYCVGPEVFKVGEVKKITEILFTCVPPVMLRKGSRGMRVQHLQLCLDVFFYDLKVDGIYGPKTEEAVREFQRENGLSPDGIYDTQTRNALAAALSRKGGAQ